MDTYRSYADRNPLQLLIAWVTWRKPSTLMLSWGNTNEDLLIG